MKLAKCQPCAGTGCNKSLPKMTAGMWRACGHCRGSGWNGPVMIPLVTLCRKFYTLAIVWR